jgi:hypothetical protein
MYSILASLLALAALPAVAADLPPAPRAGATIEERLYLKTSAIAPDDLALLAARIACVAFQRDHIAERLEDGLLIRGWNADVERLWRLSEALVAFEAAHIRPHLDAETQAVVMDVYAPSRDEMSRANRCTGFGNSYSLRAVSG